MRRYRITLTQPMNLENDWLTLSRDVTSEELDRFRGSGLLMQFSIMEDQMAEAAPLRGDREWCCEAFDA